MPSWLSKGLISSWCQCDPTPFVGPTGRGLSETPELLHDCKKSNFTSDHMFHRSITYLLLAGVRAHTSSAIRVNLVVYWDSFSFLFFSIFNLDFYSCRWNNVLVYKVDYANKKASTVSLLKDLLTNMLNLLLILINCNCFHRS